jgi:hypothetical protein
MVSNFSQILAMRLHLRRLRRLKDKLSSHGPVSYLKLIGAFFYLLFSLFFVFLCAKVASVQTRLVGTLASGELIRRGGMFNHVYCLFIRLKMGRGG